MIYIILGEGFEELEAVGTGDILMRGGLNVRYACVGKLDVTAAHGMEIRANMCVNEIDSFSAGDLIIIPGGLGGVESIESSTETMSMLECARDSGCRFGAICAGPRVLAKLNILNGINITCYPGMEAQMTGAVCHTGKSVVKDGAITTGRAPGAVFDFALCLLEAEKGLRISENVRAGLVYEK